MIDKKKQLKLEDQLQQARTTGLEQVKEMDAMHAHGKVLSMDAFSWVNPQVDMLATVLCSFPFAILWIGTHRQIETCLKLYPELLDKVKTIVIHDTASLSLEQKKLVKLTNVACVDSAHEALKFVRDFKVRNGVFMFTTEGDSSTNGKEHFDAFLELVK